MTKSKCGQDDLKTILTGVWAFVKIRFQIINKNSSTIKSRWKILNKIPHLSDKCLPCLCDFFLFLQKLFLIVVVYEISKFILLPTTNQFHNNFYMIYEGFVCGREKKANALSNACYISFFLLHFSSFWKGRPFLRPDRLAEIALNWPSMAASHSVAAPAQMLFDEILVRLAFAARL